MRQNYLVGHPGWQEAAWPGKLSWTHLVFILSGRWMVFLGAKNSQPWLPKLDTFWYFGTLRAEGHGFWLRFITTLLVSLGGLNETLTKDLSLWRQSPYERPTTRLPLPTLDELCPAGRAVAQVVRANPDGKAKLAQKIIETSFGTKWFKRNMTEVWGTVFRFLSCTKMLKNIKTSCNII